MKIRTLIPLMVLSMFCQQMISTNYYPASDQRIRYTGRIDFDQNQNALISWSGNYASFSFTGAKVSVVLSGINSKVALYVDGIKQPTLYTIKKDKDTVQVADNLPVETHSIVVRRASLVDLPLITFHGVLTDGDLLQVTDDKKLKLEFYGNSVSEGYAAATPDGAGRDNRGYDDNSSAYTCLLAQLLNADYQNVSIGGIAVCAGAGSVKIGMETRFDKLYPFTSSTLWDFSRYKPDLCIMALGVNEYYNAGGVTWDEWRARYKAIVYTLLQKYGTETSFLFAAAPMIPSRSQPVLNIKQLVSELNGEGIKAYQYVYSFFSYNGHPVASEHIKMANELYDFIQTNHIATSVEEHPLKPADNVVKYDSKSRRLTVENTANKLVSVKIYSAPGIIKYDQSVKNHLFEMTLAGYEPGIYLVSILCNGVNSTQKILVTN